MKLEELEKVLTHTNIVNIPVVEEPGKLCRDRSFTLGGETYRIEWWTNVMYLHSGAMMVIFDTVVQSGTWPNRTKLNLQFYATGVTVAIIELEQWPEATE